MDESGTKTNGRSDDDVIEMTLWLERKTAWRLANITDIAVRMHFGTVVANQLNPEILYGIGKRAAQISQNNAADFIDAVRDAYHEWRSCINVRSNGV